MSIPSVNYREIFPPKPHLTHIFSIPTYESFYQTQLELKTNAIYFHSNICGGTYDHLGLLMTDAHYALIFNAAYVRPVHPGILHIPNNSTRVAADVL